MKILRTESTNFLSFIYATYPPVQADHLQTPVYMALQPETQTAATVTCYTGELLPHLLTLIYLLPLRLIRQTVIFFFAFIPSRISVFRQFGIHCCPDFPPHNTLGVCEAIEPITAFAAKLTKKKVIKDDPDNRKHIRYAG